MKQCTPEFTDHVKFQVSLLRLAFDAHEQENASLGKRQAEALEKLADSLSERR